MHVNQGSVGRGGQTAWDYSVTYIGDPATPVRVLQRKLDSAACVLMMNSVSGQGQEGLTSNPTRWLLFFLTSVL